MGSLRVRAPVAIFALSVLVVASWSAALRSLVSPPRAEASIAISSTAHQAAELTSANQAARRAAAAAARREAQRRARARAALHHRIVTVRPGASVEIHSSPRGPVVTTVGSTDEFGSPSAFSVVRKRGDWAGVPTRALDNGQLGWIKLDRDSVEESSTPWSVEVDLSRQRASLMRGENPIRSFTVAIGRSTSPTPTGRFSITDELQSGLNPVYGCCALALSAHQPNLPEGWTGGDQIAIHGSPDNAVGGAISDGCLHATTDDLQELIAKLPLGAPVVIRG